MNRNYYEFIETDGVKLFTIVNLPAEGDKFPVVFMRTPYATKEETQTYEEIVSDCARIHKAWIDNGYAIVYQHCRGCGKSTGEFIPFIYEENDGKALHAWLKKQPFYDEKVFVKGSSYDARVNYYAKPFGNHIKGAVLNVMNTELYDFMYVNGHFKKFFANWFTGVYKSNMHVNKNLTDETRNTRPYTNYTKVVFGEEIKTFDNYILHPNRNDEFYNQPAGDGFIKTVYNDIDFPVLYQTAYYDTFYEPMINMWRKKDKKDNCAFVVSACGHAEVFPENAIVFPNGKRVDKYGDLQEIEWFNYILGKNESPVKLGTITYYSLFENVWKEGDFIPEKEIEVAFENKELTYTYNPLCPTVFATDTSGCLPQEKIEKDDVVTIYTEEFTEDTIICGNMKAELSVKSNCKDTAFYLRLSIVKDEGDYYLKDTIKSILFDNKKYKPNTFITLNFEFENISILVKKGEKLRLDVSSANNDKFYPHSNTKGLFSKQKKTKIATNTIDFGSSKLILPIK